MEIREIEKKYLSDNHKFYIERTLLSTFTIKDIKNFIQPLYEEYEAIKDDIEIKVIKEKSRHKILGELEEYCIEQVVEMMNNGDRKNELESILNIFNSHLYPLLPRKNHYKEKYKHIDIKVIPIAKVISMYMKLLLGPPIIGQGVK